ncbi:Leucine-rich repeat-containing protein 57 [Echinococcus granulosus]|uniref:Leucine rich repeat containing protein 57 n=1 Tax=Echinococcus granulosus TaxID=6210 RepID=A0A068WNU1_ECHGR|nr:Leucine-rich repeat-containing protein 57 [Echinococcus granulosus]CDS21456.1 leucine rich repeat containing protein 57 [Echinococcus granulosus]
MGNNVSSRYENAKKTGSLQLSNLKLSKFPEDVRKLTNLRALDLSSNSIQNLDPWIGAFPGLKSLNVSGNKLACLPTEVSRLTKLESLNASNNRMLSLTSSHSVVNFGSLRHLRTVDISKNNLVEFPVELCSKDIPLDLLDLSKNNISLVPDCASLLQVIELNLNENQISAISESLAKCPRLKVLRLAHNRLRLEDIPMGILEDSNISLFSIEGNPLSMKALQELPAYAKYMERFTATKRKAIP